MPGSADAQLEMPPAALRSSSRAVARAALHRVVEVDAARIRVRRQTPGTSSKPAGRRGRNSGVDGVPSSAFSGSYSGTQRSAATSRPPRPQRRAASELVFLKHKRSRRRRARLGRGTRSAACAPAPGWRAGAYSARASRSPGRFSPSASRQGTTRPSPSTSARPARGGDCVSETQAPQAGDREHGEEPAEVGEALELARAAVTKSPSVAE